MRKGLNQGFTLLEILIALTVFAILATITSTALYHIFHTRSRVNLQADRLNELQMAVSLLSRDTQQVVYRPIRSTEMRLQPAFTGQKNSMEMTRAGYTNPGALEKRSSLERVALLCEGDQLLRRSWPVLDSPHPEKFQQTVLISGVRNCHFNYLNQALELLSEWRENNSDQGPAKEPFPKAVQINFEIPEWGVFNYLLILPPGLYGEAGHS